MSAPYPGTPGTRLSYNQIQQLWIQNGGDPGWAPLMAGIAIAESGGQTNILNDNPSTLDYSVGLWQINYFDNLGPGRTAEYGSPAYLAANQNAQAQAAIKLFGPNGVGNSAWKNDATWNAWQAAGAPQKPSSSTVASWLGNAADTVGGALQNKGASGGSDKTGQGITCSDKGGGVGLPLGIGGKFGTACQLKAISGGLLIGLGSVLLITGVVILAGNTGPGKAIASATPIGRVARIGGASRSATGGASRAATGGARVAQSAVKVPAPAKPPSLAEQRREQQAAKRAQEEQDRREREEQFAEMDRRAGVRPVPKRRAA